MTTDDSLSSEQRSPPSGSRLSSALERLLARFEAFVRSTARARGLQPADIDELVQDVRVRLWRTGASDETLEQLGSSYIRRVAVSAAIDLLRRQRARREESLEMSTPTTVALQVDAADPIGDDELAQRLARALAKLPANRRLVVQLHLEGYGRDEISAMTGWTEGKVRNLLYRGLGLVRDELRSAVDEAT